MPDTGTLQMTWAMEKLILQPIPGRTGPGHKPSMVSSRGPEPVWPWKILQVGSVPTGPVPSRSSGNHQTEHNVCSLAITFTFQRLGLIMSS